MHYTWGATFIAPNGTKVWEWDKRLYTEMKHEQEVGVGCGGRGGLRAVGCGAQREPVNGCTAFSASAKQAGWLAAGCRRPTWHGHAQILV